jgi:hypothetical protein
MAMKLRHDLSALDGRDRLLLMRVAAALAEHQKRAPDHRDYELAGKLLCRRGGPLDKKKNTWKGPDAMSMIG